MYCGRKKWRNINQFGECYKEAVINIYIRFMGIRTRRIKQYEAYKDLKPTY
jgi:hypothetical protein